MGYSEISDYLIGTLLIATALGILLSLYRIFRNQEGKAGWLNVVLALLSFGIALVLLIAHTFVEVASPVLVPLVVMIGAAQAILGFAIFMIERRREVFLPEYSFGLLWGGMGVFTLLVSLFIPALYVEIQQPQQASSAAVASNTPAPTIIVPTMTVMPTVTPTSTMTVVPSETPTASATPTRARYNTRTPTPTSTLAVICMGVVNYNLNMRAAPESTADLLTTIPYESVVEVGGRNRDNTWWFVQHEGIWGWVDGQYIATGSTCDAAPELR